MAERVRRDADVPVAQFEVPYRGTMQAGGIHRVPKDAVADSLNVFVRDGKLRARAGIVKLNTSTFNAPVIGAGITVTPMYGILLAVTRAGLYELIEAAAAWTQTSTLTFASSDKAIIDLAYIESGAGVYNALIASEGYVLKQWDSVSHVTADIIPTLGTVPKAKSVCIVGKRVVTLTPPHTVQWSEVDDCKSWSTLAYNKRSSTGDLGIAVRPVGNYGLAVYKERSIHLGRITGQAFGQAFSFNEPIFVEGPAGVHAIVATPIGDVYMTKNGRIGLFNGSANVSWIGDGIWTYLQADIHPGYAAYIRGVYDYRLHTVNFYYPKLSGITDNRGMVIVNLPYEGTDIEGTTGSRPFCFKGTSTHAVTAACEMRFNTTINRSLLFTTINNANMNYYQSEDAVNDGDDEFTCSFQTGLQAMPDLKLTSVEFEAFLERGTGYGNVYVDPVLSYQLESRSGDIPDVATQIINLEFPPPTEYYGGTPNGRTRFFGLKYVWGSRSHVRYAGTYCYGKGV